MSSYLRKHSYVRKNRMKHDPETLKMRIRIEYEKGAVIRELSGKYQVRKYSVETGVRNALK